MTSKGSTGASHGSAGGRMGAATRLRGALSRQPRLTVVVPPTWSALQPSPALSALPGEQDENTALLNQLALNAAQQGAQNAIASLLSNPVVLAALNKKAKQPSGSTGKSVRRPAATAPPKPLPAPSPLQPTPKPTLDTKSRGKAVAVVPSVKYGSYTFGDVCELGGRIEKGELKLQRSVLDRKDERGEPLYKVPFSTMYNNWCKDDRVWHEEKGLSGGVLGVPHWRAERDMRRTKLRCLDSIQEILSAFRLRLSTLRPATACFMFWSSDAPTCCPPIKTARVMSTCVSCSASSSSSTRRPPSSRRPSTPSLTNN